MVRISNYDDSSCLCTSGRFFYFFILISSTSGRGRRDAEQRTILPVPLHTRTHDLLFLALVCICITFVDKGENVESEASVRQRFTDLLTRTSLLAIPWLGMKQ